MVCNKLEHMMDGHAERDRLFPLLETELNRATNVEIQRVKDGCKVCHARRNLITRPVIQPIVAKFPRE